LPAADPARRGIDPEKITLYLRQVVVVGKGEVLGMAVWRERLFAAMHLNPNLPAAYFVVPIDQAQPTSVIRARRETAPGSRISPAARGAGFNSERERRELGVGQDGPPRRCSIKGLTGDDRWDRVRPHNRHARA
jgi:hypothetical protein